MKRKADQEMKEELRNLIRGSKATFNEAVQTAIFVAEGKPLPDNMQQHIQFVTSEFEKLDAFLTEAATEQDFEFIKKRGSELEKHRVYVLPVHDLKIEAKENLEELSSWGIPQEAFNLIKETAKQLEKAEVGDAEKRSIMLQLIEDYDFWDGYVDWSMRTTSIMRAIAFLLVIVALSLSFWAFSRNNPILGFILAGVSGASISVLLKIPQITLYKNILGLYARFFSRFATGIIVSVVGLSLLSSKIINLAFEFGEEKVTIAEVLCCAENLSCSSLAESALIGIGVLFGFSERLLSSMESTLLGKLKLPKREVKKPVEGGES